MFENSGREIKSFAEGLFGTLKLIINVVALIHAISGSFEVISANYSTSIVNTIIGVILVLLYTIVGVWVARILAYLFCLVCAAFGEAVEGINETSKNTKEIAEQLKK